MYRPPTDLVAMRNFVSNGVTFTKGQNVSPLTWKFHGLDHLLSKRWIAPRPETHGRRGKERTPTPTYMAPKVKNKTLGTKTTVDVQATTSSNGWDWSLNVYARAADGWSGNRTGTIWWGDGTSEPIASWSGDSKTVTHTYPTAAGWTPDQAKVPYTVTVLVQGTGMYGTDSFDVQAPYLLGQSPGTLALVKDGVNPLQVNATLTPTKALADTSKLEWDWKDGSAIEVVEGTTATASHVYAAAGDITVSVKVTQYPAGDGQWRTGTATQTLTLTSTLMADQKAAHPARGRKHKAASHDDDEA